MNLSNFKQIFLIVGLLVFLTPTIYGQPYSEIYVFGESFVDMGNAKNLFASYWIDWPPSPPYAEGRFCNGPVFPEVIAMNLDNGPLAASYAGGTNYAYGGARSVETNFMFGSIPIPSVRNQVQTYLTDVGNSADPNALYILHDGGNDTAVAVTLFFETGDLDAASTIMEDSAQGMIESVQMLANAGAKHFLVPGAPFFSDSAWLCGITVADVLGEKYNMRLETGLAGLDDSLDILYFDLFGFETAIADHFITDCSYCVDWFDPTASVCSNPDDLFSWDQAHVTSAVQQLIGDAITVVLIKDKILNLAAVGVLNAGQSNSMLTKLDGAYRKLEERKIIPAVNKMRAFANQINAFVRSGKLSAEQADVLLVAANGIIDQP